MDCGFRGFQGVGYSHLTGVELSNEVEDKDEDEDDAERKTENVVRPGLRRRRLRRLTGDGRTGRLTLAAYSLTHEGTPLALAH